MRNLNQIKLFIAGCLLPVGAMAAPVQIQIDCAKPTVELSPHLYGLFFEDINYGADGGLYDELAQNRSFEYFNIEPRDHLREKTAGDMKTGSLTPYWQKYSGTITAYPAEREFLAVWPWIGRAVHFK